MTQQGSSQQTFDVQKYIDENGDIIYELAEMYNNGDQPGFVTSIPNEIPNSHKKEFMNKVVQYAKSLSGKSDNENQPEPPAQSAPSGVSSLSSAFNTGTAPTRPTNVPTAPSTVATGPEVVATSQGEEIVISETEISEFWTSVDGFDVTTVNKEIVQAFEYQGFNPEMIVRSFLKKARASKIDRQQVIRDINTLCALAMIKGSINEHNLKKMTEKGKQIYDELEKRYGLTRGGGKGKAAEVITVSRVAAAFPNKVMELLQRNIVPSRQFVGDFKTHNLPKAIQHQALAACVPVEFAEKSKQFILDIVTAYSADQSKVISKSKEDITTLFDRQTSFTNTSHLGPNPKSDVRIKIFKAFDWKDMFPQITTVATHIKTKMPSFTIVTEAQFLTDVSALP